MQLDSGPYISHRSTITHSNNLFNNESNSYQDMSEQITLTKPNMSRIYDEPSHHHKNISSWARWKRWWSSGDDKTYIHYHQMNDNYNMHELREMEIINNIWIQGDKLTDDMFEDSSDED